MAQDAQQKILLRGLDEIADATGVSRQTLKRWIRQRGFPARMCGDNTYRASPREIEDWWREQGKSPS